MTINRQSNNEKISRINPTISGNQTISRANEQGNHPINHAFKTVDQPLNPPTNKLTTPNLLKQPINSTNQQNQPSDPTTRVSINQSQPTMKKQPPHQRNQSISQNPSAINRTAHLIRHSDETHTTLLRAIHTPHSRIGVEASDVHIIIGSGHQVLHA